MVDNDNKQRIARRAVQAVALTIGFYLFALLIASLLLGIAVLMLVTGKFILYIFGICVFSAAIILWSLIPRRLPFEAPGPLVTEQSQPRLLGMIRSVASLTNQPVPAEVYILPDMNAFVLQRSLVVGMGGLRVMGIGLPLLQTLTVSEFMAVLAHEFGHFHHGDVKYGAWIWRAREAISRTLASLEGRNSILVLPFQWYARMFMAVSQSVSRQQEFEADALAARVIGARHLSSGLQKLEVQGALFDAFLHGEYVPATRVQARIPFLEGFTQYARGSWSRQFSEHVKRAMDNDTQADKYDSHPTTRERLQALASLPEETIRPADDPAMTLIDHPEQLEQEVVKAFVPDDVLWSTELISLERVHECVHMPLLRKSIELVQPLFRGLTPKHFFALAAFPQETLQDIQGNRAPVTPREAKEVQDGVGAVVALALLDRGWVFDGNFGDDVILRCHVDGQEYQVDPFNILGELERREATQEYWTQLCVATGIGELDLGVEQVRLNQPKAISAAQK